MAKFEFKGPSGGGVDSSTTQALLGLMGGGGTSQGFAAIQATLDRQAQQESIAARLEQDRREFLYRISQDEVQRHLAEQRLGLDVEQFRRQTMRDDVADQRAAINMQQENARLALSVNADQRAAQADQRATEAERRAVLKDAASLVNSGLEAARAKEALLQQDEKRNFTAIFAPALAQVTRTEVRTLAEHSKRYGGVFMFKDAKNPDGTPTAATIERLRRNVVLNNPELKDDPELIDSAVLTLLKPQTYQVVDLDDRGPNSIAPILAAGAMAGMDPSDVIKQIREANKALAIGDEELQERVDRDAEAFGKFSATQSEVMGRALNTRLDELLTNAQGQGSVDVPLNEGTLASLDVKALSSELQSSFSDVGVNIEQLQTPQFWRQFGGPVTFNTGTGEIVFPKGANAKVVNRFRPALELLFSEVPQLAGELQARAAGGGLTTTPAERAKTRLNTPTLTPKPAKARSDGSAAGQSNAINGTRMTEEEFLRRTTPWLLDDFGIRSDLGLPDDYDPEN